MMPDTNSPIDPAGVGIDATIRRALDQYFKTLDGQPPHALYDMVIQAAERPLLDVVMARCQGNVSHAAAALGITRNTLRKKLALHQLGPYAGDQSNKPA